MSQLWLCSIGKQNQEDLQLRKGSSDVILPTENIHPKKDPRNKELAKHRNLNTIGCTIITLQTVYLIGELHSTLFTSLLMLEKKN